MNPLPAKQSDNATSPQQASGFVRSVQSPSQPIQQVGSGISGKEKESGQPVGDMLKPAGGVEVELPAEVTAAGVSIRPTTVPIPLPVSQMGVRPAGTNIPAAPVAGTIALPLTDDQIAKGLHQSIVSSLRWLAEWCVRQVKKARLSVKIT